MKNAENAETQRPRRIRGEVPGWAAGTALKRVRVVLSRES